MLKATRRRLLATNALVFALVIVLFSITIGAAVLHQCDKQEQQKLQTLSDALINSIETPEMEGEPPEPMPDVVEPGGGKTELMKEITLQWFEPDGHLKAAKGSLPIHRPFERETNFFEQSSPHALMITQQAVLKGELKGYLRVAMSLDTADKFKRDFLLNLALGTAAAIGISGMAVLFLVRQSLRPIEETLLKLTQFTADASHELKNPIMAVKTNAEVALRYADGIRESDKEKFSFILNAATQMSKLTADLIELARADQAPINVQTDSGDLCILVPEVIAELAPHATASNIDVNSVLRANSLIVKASPEDIKKVLRNLIMNAIQYSKPETCVTVSASPLGSDAQVEVLDFGIGIKDEELSHVFDRFWRSDKARNHTGGGNGLGLSIVQSIVQRHKGSIVIRSRAGEGTTVTVKLPLNG